jgi:hypothetical protein
LPYKSAELVHFMPHNFVIFSHAEAQSTQSNTLKLSTLRLCVTFFPCKYANNGLILTCFRLPYKMTQIVHFIIDTLLNVSKQIPSAPKYSLGLTGNYPISVFINLQLHTIAGIVASAIIGAAARVLVASLATRALPLFATGFAHNKMLVALGVSTIDHAGRSSIA